MKKWALPLSLAVALAANSAAALAATDPIATNFRGQFKTQLQYNSKEVNESIINGVHDRDNHSYHLPTGAFGAVDVDLRGDIILSPNAQNRFVLELRHRIRGDKLLDAFPTRFYSAYGASNNRGAFGGGHSGNIFGASEDNSTAQLIDKAYLENKSAWWADGPEITTRIGRQDPNWNPWVARFNRFDRTGVTIQGFKLGPADLNIGYIWGGNARLERVGVLRPGETISTPGATRGINSAVLTARIPVESAQIDLAAVRTAAQGHSAFVDYAAGLQVPLTDSVNLSGAYARDGMREKNAYNVKLGAKLGVANLSAMYRSVDENFQPVYESREDFMNPEKRTQSDVHDERTGFKVAAEVDVHNWKLSGAFDSSHRSWLGYTKDEKIDTVDLGARTRFSTVDFWASAKLEKSKETRDAYVDEYSSWYGERVVYREAKKNDKNTYIVGLGTNFDVVRATYELKITDEKKTEPEKRTIHTITLGAPVKVAYLDTLHLGATLALRSGDLLGREKTGWGVDVAWQGKNGLRAGIHYTKGYNGELKNRLYNDTNSSAVRMKSAEPDELRKYVYPDGTTHYLGNGLAVTAGWGIEF